MRQHAQKFINTHGSVSRDGQGKTKKKKCFGNTLMQRPRTTSQRVISTFERLHYIRTCFRSEQHFYKCLVQKCLIYFLLDVRGMDKTQW